MSKSRQARPLLSAKATRQLDSCRRMRTTLQRMSGVETPIPSLPRLLADIIAEANRADVAAMVKPGLEAGRAAYNEVLADMHGKVFKAGALAADGLGSEAVGFQSWEDYHAEVARLASAAAEAAYDEYMARVAEAGKAVSRELGGDPDESIAALIDEVSASLKASLQSLAEADAAAD